MCPAHLLSEVAEYFSVISVAPRFNVCSPIRCTHNLLVSMRVTIATAANLMYARERCIRRRRRRRRRRNIDSHTQYGRTALMGAAEYGHTDCARLLLDAGADKEVKEHVRARRSTASAVG